MGFLIVMALLLVVMYVLMIRPQRQRQRDQQNMVDEAGVGDDILTSGGIYGTITRTDGDDIVVEIADGLSVHMTRRGVAAVLPPETVDDDETHEVVDAEAVEEGGPDEALVTGSEEAVTGRGDADDATADRR